MYSFKVGDRTYSITLWGIIVWIIVIALGVYLVRRFA